MIHSSHRFHGRSSLRFVYQKGQTVRGQLVALRYVRNERLPAYRVAVVISRKVSKSAVVRNRVRRRLYEIVRKHAHRIAGAYDLVFTIYGEEVATMSHASLQKIVLDQLSKSGVINNQSTPGATHAMIEGKETNL